MQKTFPIQLAKEAILLHDFDYALSLLKPEAQRGDIEAQFLAAFLYFNDPILTKAEAQAWMQNAAEKGHADAKYIMASYPELEPEYIFSPPTNASGWKLLQAAAELGSDAAQGDLGRYYAEGVPGLAQDLQKSRYWRNLIASQKRYVNPEVRYSLGVMLLDGIGGEANFDTGIRMLLLCSTQPMFASGNPHALKAFELLMDIANRRLYGISDAIGNNLSHEFEREFQLVKLRMNYPSPAWLVYLRQYIARTLVYDLTEATFDEFAAFIFEHLVVEPARHLRTDFDWGYTAEVKVDPLTILNYYIQLFRDPLFLLERYNRAELAQGFWKIQGFHNWCMGCIFCHEAVPVEKAEAFIRAMYDLYAKLFVFDDVEELASFMWWEGSFRVCWNYQIPKRVDSKADMHRFYEAIFETLTLILQLDSLACQVAALHGLGHFKHPKKEQVILEFLAAHPELTDWREYALRAIEGKVL